MKKVNETINVRKVDWRIFIVNLITVIVPLYFIVSYAYKIQHTGTQTGFLICSLSILGGINFLIVKSGTYLIDVILKDDEIEIIEKGKIIYHSKFKEVDNYNSYWFINKRGGYILRFSGQTGSFCSLLTWVNFTKKTDADQQNYNLIQRTINAKLAAKKKNIGKDYIIKIFSAMPYIFLGLAILSIIGIFLFITTL